MSFRDIPREVIDAVKRFVHGLEKRGFRVEKVYLFGSYARGTWLKTSDVDLVVVSSDFRGMPFTERLDVVNRVVWEEGIEPYVEALPYTPEELEERVERSVVLMDAKRYWIPLDDVLREGRRESK